MNNLDTEDAQDMAARQPPDSDESVRAHQERIPFKEKLKRYWTALAVFTYIAGVGSGYILWGNRDSEKRTVAETNVFTEKDELNLLLDQVNPPEGFELPIKYGDFAPKLIASGAIDYAEFVKLYKESGSPLSEQQIEILTKGSDTPIQITRKNQHFLLNLFWALGLANENRILTQGPMMRDGKEKAMKFASTGGWTLAARPVAEFYASQPIIRLTDEQQKRIEEVAAGVYRPCCNNPTIFPDCNHGMAMLGLLELMASQGASVSEMFTAAKYINAFWFPQQTAEVAILFKTTKNDDFSKADASQVVGQQYFSGSGFQAVHQWLAQNGKLEQIPESGGSCGVN